MFERQAVRIGFDKCAGASIAREGEERRGAINANYTTSAPVQTCHRLAASAADVHYGRIMQRVGQERAEQSLPAAKKAGD